MTESIWPRIMDGIDSVSAALAEMATWDEVSDGTASEAGYILLTLGRLRVHGDREAAWIVGLTNDTLIEQGHILELAHLAQLHATVAHEATAALVGLADLGHELRHVDRLAGAMRDLVALKVPLRLTAAAAGWEGDEEAEVAEAPAVLVH